MRQLCQCRACHSRISYFPQQHTHHFNRIVPWEDLNLSGWLVLSFMHLFLTASLRRQFWLIGTSIFTLNSIFKIFFSGEKKNWLFDILRGWSKTTQTADWHPTKKSSSNPPWSPPTYHFNTILPISLHMIGERWNSILLTFLYVLSHLGRISLEVYPLHIIKFWTIPFFRNYYL